MFLNISTLEEKTCSRSERVTSSDGLVLNL